MGFSDIILVGRGLLLYVLTLERFVFMSAINPLNDLWVEWLLEVYLQQPCNLHPANFLCRLTGEYFGNRHEFTASLSQKKEVTAFTNPFFLKVMESSTSLAGMQLIYFFTHYMHESKWVFVSSNQSLAFIFISLSLKLWILKWYNTLFCDLFYLVILANQGC